MLLKKITSLITNIQPFKIEPSIEKKDSEGTILQQSIDKPTQHKDQKGEKEKGSVNKEIESNICKSEMSQKDEINIHPLDSTIHLSVHQKLLPPGRIIHIVRQYEGSRT